VSPAGTMDGVAAKAAFCDRRWALALV